MGTGLCDNCGKHPGTQIWTGENGVLAYTHGLYEMWCECCVLKAQLERARSMAGMIPDLEARLAKACKES